MQSPQQTHPRVGPTVFFTAVGMVGAVVVFGLILRFARRRPVRLFRRVALVVLLVSVGRTS